MNQPLGTLRAVFPGNSFCSIRLLTFYNSLLTYGLWLHSYQRTISQGANVTS